ncbi:hypothetical protein G9A89_008744 [Geosiphon pyriformis]|nr:hypothetical protein G9A89_008744 [Geosiphon pyriformis]
MDLKTALGSNMSKKKASKGAFYGSANVILENIKHSGNEKNISLSKSRPSDSVYSNVNSLSGDDENIGMTGVNGGFLLGSIATTSKVKHINTGTVFGFSDFFMDDDDIVLPFHLPIFLKKKWIDPKIIKILVKVLVRKFFALDINLLAVDGKSATAKIQLIRKTFSPVNGFGGDHYFFKI